MNHEPKLSQNQVEAVGRYLAAEMDAAERAELELAAVTDDNLAEALYQQREIAGLLAPAPEILRPSRPWYRGPGPITGMLAAAAMAAFFLVLRPGDEYPAPGPVFRGGDGQQPMPVTAEGVLDTWPTALIWRTVPSAVRYRVQLYDDQSQPLLTTTTPDTMVFLSREQMPRNLPNGGHWQVIPILEGDREGSAGPLIRFEVHDR